MNSSDNKRGGEIMAVSGEFREWVRNTRIGLTDAQVCEVSGLNYATWRRMLAGHVPSEDKIAAYALAVQSDPLEGLALARKVQPNVTTADVIRAVLESAGWGPVECKELMACYHKLSQESEKRQTQAA